MPAPGYPLSRDPVSGRVLPRGVGVSERGRIQWKNPPGVTLTNRQRGQLSTIFRTRGKSDLRYQEYLVSLKEPKKKRGGIIDWVRGEIEKGPGLPPEPPPDYEGVFARVLGSSGHLEYDMGILSRP